MNSLDDTWGWYRAAVTAAKRLERLAEYWGRFPWGLEEDAVTPLAAGPNLTRYARLLDEIARDNTLGKLDADTIRAGAATVRDELDDLAVLVMFAAFEAHVRDWITARVRPELDVIRDPTIRWAAGNALKAVEDGSFGRALEPYKSVVGAGLVEEVNQVRRHRNWVAHGRREDLRPEVTVEPREAYDRLARFLAALRGAGPPL